MATVNFAQVGGKLDYLNTSASAIPYLSIISVADMVLVAAENIQPGSVGSAYKEGVFEFPAVTNVQLNVGDRVFWDNTAGKITNISYGNIPAGVVISPKSLSSATVRVSLKGGFVPKPYKSAATKRVRITGDSISLYGNIRTKIAAKLGATIYGDKASGSHAIAGLAAFADEVWAYVTGENAIKYSADMSQSPWTVSPGVSAVSEIGTDGNKWSTVTRAAGANSAVIAQDLVALPSGFTGIAVRNLLYVPYGSTCKSVEIQFQKYAPSTDWTNIKRITIPDLEEGQYYSFMEFISAAKLPAGWVAGDTVKMKVLLGGDSGAVENLGTNCVLCFGTWNVSLKSPNGVENPIVTGSSAAAAGTATLSKIRTYQKYYDLTCVFFGRNEAEKNEVAPSNNKWVNAWTYAKTLDKIIHQARKTSGQVIALNCPPKANADLKTWNAADNYLVKGLNAAFNMIRAKNNCGVNVYEAFLNSGLSPSLLVADDLMHENYNLGSDMIADLVADEVNSNKNVANHSNPLIPGAVKVYMSGNTVTGTWVPAQEDDSGQNFSTALKSVMGNISDISQVSSAAGDSITYTGINGTVLGVLFRVGTGFSGFSIKLNPGGSNEVSYTVGANWAGTTNELRAWYITDNLPPDCTVKITADGAGCHLIGLVVA